MSDFATPWTAARQASLFIANFQSLFKLMSIESVMPSNHLILYHPLLLLPSIVSSIRIFSNESALRIRWPKYWSFSFSISPSSEHSRLISFRMDWLDLLEVKGTLKCLLTASDLAFITSHIHNWVLFLLWVHVFVLSEVISPLISNCILGTYRPGEFIFQCPIFVPFHTVHGVLKVGILKWFAIPFSKWIMFCQNSPPWPIRLGWPYMTWFIVSLR